MNRASVLRTIVGCAWAGMTFSGYALPVRAQVANEFAALVPIATAYAGNDINHVAFRQGNSLTTVVVDDLTYQFTAYYRNTGGGNRRISVARRVLGETDWEAFNYSGGAFGDPNSNATDSHNVVNIAIDGDGYMHMSWGMHNDDLIYRRSTGPVINSNDIEFDTTNEPMTGDFENQVTYPQFYNVPDSSDLLFFYRNGGSGSGNNFLNRYDAATGDWSAVRHPLQDGISTSVNPYLNTTVFDSQGHLHMSWTNRATPAFQTNHNINYARSADQGVTWSRMDGTPYDMPISATAELVVPIPQQSTLINQTSMTVDMNDHPLIASWWAPGAQQGDHTRQYMLAYYDGSAWQTSQITNRAPEPKQTDSTVRDLARPLVMVADDNRTLVVTRYDERDNVITIAHSRDNQNWDFVDLTTQSLGTYEPTYDAELWRRENKLHLLYQPVGLGSNSSTISVLEWDAKAFFLDLIVPLHLEINRTTGATTITNPADHDIALVGYSLTSAGGQLAPGGWSSFQSQTVDGWSEVESLATELSESSGASLPLVPSQSVSLGNAFAGQPIAFGVDGPADVEFSYTTDEQSFNGTIGYVGESLNNLALWVDPEFGLARLENTSPFAIAIDAYTIRSSMESLDPEGWTSLAAQDAGDGAWEESNTEPGRLSELHPFGDMLLDPGDSFELGQLFNAGGEQDLVFEFLIAGSAIAQSMTGVVLYVSLEVPGDLNSDGMVDAADYTRWRDTGGTPEQFEQWKANFGNGSSAGAGTTIPVASSTTVPEPASWFAALLSVLIASCRRTTRSASNYSRR